MTGVKEIGRAGVSAGWRKRVADRVAPVVADRTRFDHGDVRAALGVAFLGVSIYYVARTLRAARAG